MVSNLDGIGIYICFTILSKHLETFCLAVDINKLRRATNSETGKKICYVFTFEREKLILFPHVILLIH